MDQRLVAHLKSTVYAAAPAEDKGEHEINYHRIHQCSDQLSQYAKQAMHMNFVGLEEMDRMVALGEAIQKELHAVYSHLVKRKSLELMLPSPNTQHHLPCSSLLSPNSSAPSSPAGAQNVALSVASSSTNLISSSGSPGSPSSLNVDNSSMSIPSTGVLQADDYWRRKNLVEQKAIRRSQTPNYVHFTEQMIIAQSSKKKRPVESTLYCHNCKTKDTPEWRRGPMGVKTLCNACGIRWRLSQNEAKQKRSDRDGTPSPPQSSPSPQFLIQTPQPQQQLSSSQQLLQQQHQPSPQISSSLGLPLPQNYLQQQNLLHQQQYRNFQQQQQLLQQQHLQQYNHSHHQPQQQHMVLPGHVGLAQENIPASGASRGSTSNPVISSLVTSSPIAT